MRSVKKKTGPKPLGYIPPQFRHIEGIENVTTRHQLVRLREYMATVTSKRAPYIRLGASVPPFSDPNNVRIPSATYAVCVDGEIEVIKRNQDPRAAERWFSCNLRPWNIAREFAEIEVGR